LLFKAEMPQLSSKDSSSGRVVLQVQDDTASVTLSFPGRMNVITVSMWKELRRIFLQISENSKLRAVVIQGDGENFAAGADIAEFPEIRCELASLMHYHEEILAPALSAISTCPHPVVASIRGVCVGGGLEIASQCDLRIASIGSRFGAPIARLGFPMAPSEFRGLLALTGRSTAMELLLEGRILHAEEALRKGLIHRLVQPDELENEIAQTVDRLRLGSPAACRINKQTLRRLTPEPPPLSPEELRAFYASWAESEDHREGIRAFLEKRPAQFTNS
jgi:enoyl-CoA hydratase